MKTGTQVACVPHHANGDLTHPDVEFGFVMCEAGEHDHFCRYWKKDKPGVLRTVANSERTPNDCLVEYKSVDQTVVVLAIMLIEA